MSGIETKYTKKVLIVDDEPYILRVLKLKLENAGYEVVTAVNGLDGLEKFVKEMPAVVISDVNMPHFNGQDMYKMMELHMKKDPFLVIVMTSSLDSSIKRWANDISNIHFLEKPFSPNNVLHLIKGYFSKLQETNANL